MEIYRHQLSRQALLATPDPDLNFLFAACHLANELNILHKLTHWTFSGALEAPTSVREGQMAQAMFLFRLLAGKLNEGHEMLRKAYWGTKISKIYDSHLRDEAKSSLEGIKRYFDQSDCLVRRVRNDFAFHYSPQDFASTLRNLPEGEDLTYYPSDTFNNVLYYFAEVTAVTSMLGVVDKENLNRFLNDLTSLAKYFLGFIQGWLEVFFCRFPQVFRDSEPASVPEMGRLQSFESITIPFFTFPPERRG